MRIVPYLAAIFSWHRPLRCGLSITLLTASFSGSCFADQHGTAKNRIENFKSRHFDVHTDLDKNHITRRLARMESVLAKSEAYWGRRINGKIDCYLVDDLKKWRTNDFPTRNARVVLKRIGGGTFVDQSRVNRRVGRSSVIYATNRPGVVEHEVVHAYCFMAFGPNGPDWYREGMAELMAQNATREKGASCRPDTLAKLRKATLSLKTIVSRDSFTAPIVESVVRSNDAGVGFDVSASSWNAEDDRVLTKAKIAYAESWALCYLLHHNPNYHKRFRVLGQKLVEGSNVRFEDVFRPMMENIDFELKMLGKSINNGYRADLCRWPWAVVFQPVQVGRTIRVPLKACAGFQATRIEVVRGQKYSLRAHGLWSVEDHSDAIDANGNDEGDGRIEAIIQNGFDLCEPFPLDAESDFSVPKSGRLFLRCYDDWAQLADNRGSVQVRIKRTR